MIYRKIAGKCRVVADRTLRLGALQCDTAMDTRQRGPNFSCSFNFDLENTSPAMQKTAIDGLVFDQAHSLRETIGPGGGCGVWAGRVGTTRYRV
jgi:hypothetical protein